MSWRAFESIKRFNLLKIGAGWGDDTTTRRSNGIFSGQRQCRLTKCVLEITGFRWSLEVISCSYHTPELKLRHDKYKTVIFGPNMGIKISKIYDAVLGTHWTTIASRLLVGIAILGRALPGIGRSAWYSDYVMYFQVPVSSVRPRYSLRWALSHIDLSLGVILLW